MSNQQYYGNGGPPSQQYGGNTNAPASQQYSAPAGAPPGHHAPQRTNTEAGLPQGQERSEQLEYLQSYEATAPQTEDDKDQETLRKEFPDIDSSLIAAIYGDSKSLSATREMLQELSSTT